MAQQRILDFEHRGHPHKVGLRVAQKLLFYTLRDDATRILREAGNINRRGNVGSRCVCPWCDTTFSKKTSNHTYCRPMCTRLSYLVLDTFFRDYLRDRLKQQMSTGEISEALNLSVEHAKTIKRNTYARMYGAINETNEILKDLPWEKYKPHQGAQADFFGSMTGRMTSPQPSFTEIHKESTMDRITITNICNVEHLNLESEEMRKKINNLIEGSVEFWIVFCITTNRYVTTIYFTEERAWKAADALAEQNDGLLFFVLHSTGFARVQKPVVHHKF